MCNSIRRIWQQLFIVFCTLSLVACFQPTPPPSVEFEPGPSPVLSELPQCPDFSGTYRLTHGSRETRLFSPYMLPPHEMDMVQLVLNSVNGFYAYRLKMDEARFVEQVSALRSSNPAGYATWRELITQWQQKKREMNDTSVLEGEILQLGPLPERRGLLTPTQCEDLWALAAYQVGSPVNLEGDENAGSVETETRLSLGKRGALLFRYDNYRTTSFIFDSTIRTGIINSTYAKLDPMQHSLFDWEVTDQIAPGISIMASPENLPAEQMGMQQAEQIERTAGSVSERSASIPALLVDVQQYAMAHLPAGGTISQFKLDEVPQNNAELWLSMQGETNSNKEVSDLLRAMMQHVQVENVELVSVQQSAKNKIEFVIRVKLKNQ